jgi:hypothetical protein
MLGEKVRVTVVLLQDYKRGQNNYRVWNNLLALDFDILEEDEVAGLFRGTYTREQASILEEVVGVASIHIKKYEEDEDRPRFMFKAGKAVRVDKDERGRKAA